MVTNWRKEAKIVVNHDEGVMNILSCMCEVPPLFKIFTNFEVREKNDFDSLVCLIIFVTMHIAQVLKGF